MISNGTEALDELKSQLAYYKEYAKVATPTKADTIDHETDEELDTIEKYIKTLDIIKECLVAEFKLYEENGEYFIYFYMDELEMNSLKFKLKDKDEYDLLKETLKGERR